MNLSEHVEVLKTNDKTIYLLGTAHVSEASVDEVHSVIDEVKPDTVCVELCQTRYDHLTDEDRWKKLDIFSVIREGKTLLMLANLAIGAYQRRIGNELGVKPGAELLAAAKKAEEIGAEMVLVDRDIRVTLKRTWANLGFFQKMNLLGAIMGSMVTQEEVDEKTIEDLKEKAHLSEMMDEFAKALPAVKEPLIDERDTFMMKKIEDSPGERIVAVVGAGHVRGMTQKFGKGSEEEFERISALPDKRSWVGLLKWVIPVAIVTLFIIGIREHQGETWEEMVWGWVLPNVVGASVLTAFAGARPLSIICAGISSPITSLIPAIGAGMVVGFVEAWLRKPTIKDAESINEDVQSLGGLYRNNFTRVLLVAVMANLGSAIGGWMGTAFVLDAVVG